MTSPNFGLSSLEESHLTRLIAHALDEDAPQGDLTSLATISADSHSNAIFLAKQTGVLSGLSVCQFVFHQVDKSIKCDFTCQDGQAITKNTIFGTASGPTRSLLLAERLVLNLMQRMSGIATQTHLMTQQIRQTAPHSKTKLLDTRKTVPGLRMLDKLAVRHGGGLNHRIGLSDMLLIKDNHITACGSAREAIVVAHAYLRDRELDVKIEVEARTLEEVREVLEQKKQVQRLMLDNMVKVKRDESGRLVEIDCSLLEEALKIVNGQIETEASGNVMIDTVGEIAKTNVDYISCGALTHSVQAFDISMKIKQEEGTVMDTHSS